MIEIKSNKELSRYIKELEEDVQLSVANLREKSLTSSSIRAKWLAYYYKEKENLVRIKNTKAKFIKQKMANSKCTDTVLRLKAEESIAKNDETMRKLNKLSEITQSNIEYIERAMDILANFGFSIRNATEILKLEKC